jgi:type IV pilus assembly protein PilC
MKKYYFNAISRSGEKTTGEIVARNKKEAEENLIERGLAAVELSLDFSDFLNSLSNLNFGWVAEVERLMFTKRLSVMLKAHLTIDEAIGILKEQTLNAKMKTILQECLKTIENGKPLSTALRNYPGVFSSLYVNVLKAGEQSGTLEESLEHLAKQMAKSYELKQKIKGALFYPFLVLGLTMALGFFLGIFILPRITEIFANFKAELPFVTRMLVSFADFLDSYGFLFFGAIVLLIAAFFWSVRKFSGFRYKVHRFSLQIPVIGEIVRNFNIALFSRTLATLMQSGVPIVDALASTGSTFNNEIFRESLNTAAKGVQRGTDLSTELSKYEDFYPPIVFRMISVGEKTGQMEDVLFYLADFFESEVDQKSKNLSTIIEPAMLLFIGSVVGVVALSIILPIYQITGSFRL